MASQMFGAPVGISAAMADQRANALNALTLQQGQVKLKADVLALQQEEEMIRLMQRGRDDGEPLTPTNMAESMDQMAEYAMQSGQPVKAEKFASTASTIRHQTHENEKAEQDVLIKNLTMLGSLMGEVQDEQSWARANAMFQLQSGKASPYAKAKYSPELVAQIREGVQTAQQRALTDAARARVEASEAQVTESSTRRKLLEAQTSYTKARERNLGKAGATSQLPNATDVQAVTDLLMQDYRTSLPIEEARILARPVAERAKKLMVERELTRSQAAALAYQEAKNAGDFGGLTETQKGAGSRSNPLEMPKTSTLLKQNKYYALQGKYAGKVGRWNGTKFIIDDPAVNMGAFDDENESEDEDEEEDF